MVIWAENRSEVKLRMRDYYEWDGLGKVGYYGGINISIAVGERKSIRSSLFTDELKNHIKPQTIRVLRDDGKDGTPLLVLFHYQFKTNNGCSLLLEMDDKGEKLVDRFNAPDGNGGRTLVQKIRDFFLLLRGTAPN